MRCTEQHSCEQWPTIQAIRCAGAREKALTNQTGVRRYPSNNATPLRLESADMPDTYATNAVSRVCGILHIMSRDPYPN